MASRSSEYPFHLAAVQQVERLRMERGITFFAGENGTGKSTILEALAVLLGFNPEGGSADLRFETVARSSSSLHEALELVPLGGTAGDGFFVRTEGLFNLATEVDRQDEEMDAIAREAKRWSGVTMTGYRPLNRRYGGGRSLHQQSHGEAMLALLSNRLSGGGVYLLDEPETALSPLRQMALLTVLHGLVRRGSQIVIATHSPILLAYPEARIYRFDEDGIRETEYEETDAYRVTRDFLEHRERSLRTLLGGEDEAHGE
ncbi:MAG TPA: AAA family ATPase [Longimicrobium sp.]|uniref:AAA family ATPase n=1 Tax=Longimicrobium sp. TaxID=2029185 RepID=UPI002ED89362